MKNPSFVTGAIYHIFNRGIDKRLIFLDDKDHLRFIHDLFEFNDLNPALNVAYFYSKSTKSMEVSLPYISQMSEPRELLVDLLAFSLMPNHYHLMVRQKRDGGITEFMRKLGTGYTNFFNQKYERAGALFQGCFKAIIVKRESHFMHLPYYIHSNSLDLRFPEWRSGQIKDLDKAIKFLKNYRWSSFPDYIGKNNFPSLTQREFLLEFFGGPERYLADTIKWLNNPDLESANGLILE